MTVPASFDAVARELTIEAAAKAGLKHVTLLEEPQAAFYAWLAAQGNGWRKKVKVGDVILVCDVGGGTTDFTLIAVSDEGGDLALSRLAVGEHILLGGDNMDLALAHAVAASLPQGMDGLDPIQRIALGYACRAAKETLFTDQKKAAAAVTVLGRGSKVIGGTIKTELSRDLLRKVLLDGFLPRCGPGDFPVRGRRIGLTEIGLPYAADPAVTRHLARFLGQQAGSLHTGGRHRAPLRGALQWRRLQGGRAAAARPRDTHRVGQAARCPSWSPPTSIWPWPTARLTTAWCVAAGASAFGAAWLGPTTSASRPPRPPFPASRRRSRPSASCRWAWRRAPRPTCPAPRSAWSSARPTEFRFLSSTTRRDDTVGTILDRWNAEEVQELDSLETALEPNEAHAGEAVPVRLHSRVTEVGTLELSCQSTRDPRRWKLEFNVREGSED